MKHNNHPQNQYPTSAKVSRLTSIAIFNRNDIAFTPSPDAVARRAYFAYESQGSVAGHSVQHWLAAEADLLAERSLTRTHRFHHQS